MKVKAVSMNPDEMIPKITIKVYRDTNNNWFASCENSIDTDKSFFCSATYDNYTQAISDILEKLPYD